MKYVFVNNRHFLEVFLNMPEKPKKIAIGVVVTLLVLATGIFALNYYIESKLKKEIAGLPNNIKIAYKAIEVNSLKGKLRFVNPQVSVYGKTTGTVNLGAELQSFTIDDVNYWDYLFNNKISIENIIFNQPKVTYYHNEEVKSKSYSNVFKNPFDKLIHIENLQINNGTIKVFNATTDSLMLQSEKIDFEFSSVQIEKKSNKKSISYQNFSFYSTNLFYRLNTFDNLLVEHLTISPKTSKIKGLRIKTKYKKEQLSKLLSTERDHFDLSVDSLVVKNQDFGFKHDANFYFKSERVDFFAPYFDIYRDKLVSDDLTYKPLYSKMLRDLKFSLTLNKVILNDGKISYTEKVKEGTQGGKLEFSKLHAKIKNLSNTYKDTLTVINVSAIFMETTPLKVTWSFDVNTTTDAFLYKAELGILAAQAMNQFMEPNLNVALKGIIDKTYFTISGNDRVSQIDLKLKYDHFDVVVLKQNGKEENKFLSGLVNLFVSKDSKKDSGSFRYGSKTDVERDQTKSVFNYQWLNIKAGLLNAMTGDGKK